MALTATVTFRTTPELKERVNFLAKETRRPTSFYYNLLLEELKKLDKPIQKRIKDYMDEVAKLEDPRSRGKILVENLSGLWRYRVGDIRVVCEIKDAEILITVLRIADRKEKYEKANATFNNRNSYSKTDEDATFMRKRSTECETVFGQTKGNLGFRRFHLRGKEKVGTEWGLLMLGHDFKQLIRLINA